MIAHLRTKRIGGTGRTLLYSLSRLIFFVIVGKDPGLHKTEPNFLQAWALNLKLVLSSIDVSLHVATSIVDFHILVKWRQIKYLRNPDILHFDLMAIITSASKMLRISSALEFLPQTFYL